MSNSPTLPGSPTTPTSPACAVSWLELPPHEPSAPRRLLVCLHGAGSRPETFAPVAVAWQMKFTGAVAVILQAGLHSAGRPGHHWYDERCDPRERAERARLAAIEVAAQIRNAQRSEGFTAEQTTIIGFAQGANVALELALQSEPCASIVVTYAGRLLRPVPPGTRILPSVHLLHGEFDTTVFAIHAQRAFRAMRKAGARVSLDILAGGIHSIGQDMINVGTTRAMQTLFRERIRITLDQFHVALAVSIDSEGPAQPGTRRQPPHH